MSLYRESDEACGKVVSLKLVCATIIDTDVAMILKAATIHLVVVTVNYAQKQIDQSNLFQSQSEWNLWPSKAVRMTFRAVMNTGVRGFKPTYVVPSASPATRFWFRAGFEVPRPLLQGFVISNAAKLPIAILPKKLISSVPFSYRERDKNLF